MPMFASGQVRHYAENLLHSAVAAVCDSCQFVAPTFEYFLK